ncbi:BQ2448_1771 [Microbotryum intermedium]|uniref:BQ2448_1771 protein n=1 Tax=Microbotryum intermedium TaxID=269621 RepID=A0A238FB39_9BASI|nr:BQ2448_1771 [Microbotryum intermedium]
MQSSLQSLCESVLSSNRIIELTDQLPVRSPTSSPRHGSTSSTRLSGATRLSQEPGTATRSLIQESQSRHHASSHSVTLSRSDPSRPYSVTLARTAPPPRRSQQSLQQEFSSPSISTSDSWDEDETPYSQARQRLDAYSRYIASQFDGEDGLIQAFPHLASASSAYAASYDDHLVKAESEAFDIRVEADPYATSARPRAVPNVSSSQEVEALADEMPQPPHFRKWLNGIAALNSSEQGRAIPLSSSSIRSYGSFLSDAASLISEATNSRAVDSLFQTGPEATPRSAWSLTSYSSQGSQDDPLLPGDYSFETEEPSGYLESVSEDIDEASSAIIDVTQVTETKSASTSNVSSQLLPEKETGAWRLVSLTLAVGWTATIARSFWSSDRAALQDVNQGISSILVEDLAVPTISNPVKDTVFGVLREHSGSESPSTMLLITIVFGAVMIPFVTAHRRRQPEAKCASEKLIVDPRKANCMIEAIEAYTRGHLEKARQLFERVATGESEQKRSALEYQARTLYRMGRVQDSSECYTEAWELFHQVIEMDKLSGQELNCASAKASLGRTMFRQNKLDGARIMIEQALKLDGKLAYAHEYLAKVIASMKLGTKGEAMVLGHLKEALKIDPDRYTARVFLGEWLHLNCKGLSPKKTTTRLHLAEEALEHVVTTRPDHVSAYARLALLARTRGDCEAELVHWKRVLSIREEGFYDFDLSKETNDHARGDTLVISICLALDLARETERLERIRLLSDALSKPSSGDALLRILRSIAILHTSRDQSPKTVKIVFGAKDSKAEASDSEDSKTIKGSSHVAANTRSRKKSASAAVERKDPLDTIAVAKQVLKKEEDTLRHRIKQGTTQDKVENHGLLALALYGLCKSDEAKEQVKCYHYWLQLYAIVADETAAASIPNATDRETALRYDLIERALVETAALT